MFIIQASNIHEGGGKVLLRSLVQELSLKTKVILLLDQRNPITTELNLVQYPNLNIELVKPSFFARLKAEFKLGSYAKQYPDATFFFFGNLPPLLPIKNKVVLYYHTVLYFKKFRLKKSGLVIRFKHAFEAFWVKHFLASVTEVIVQSEFVKTQFQKEFHFENVKIIPFVNEDAIKEIPKEMMAESEPVDFVYLAAATDHKNHPTLIEAWRILASEGLFPSLHLTVDKRYLATLTLIENARTQSAAKIVNHGMVPHSKAMSLYLASKAIVFPSLSESFGLPLLEAKKYNLPILASEMDYVRDLIDPVETFDPTSAKSIARAVKRFLKKSDTKINVSTASQFANYLLN